jgi:hypothetical protein
MSCLVAGDSIALMVAAFVSCTVDAKVGIGSAAIVARVRPATIVVISAGSNDPRNPRLADNLRAARRKAGDSKVIWIVPALRPAAAAVRAVAAVRGDKSVSFTPGRDGVHPKCPRCLAHVIFGPASTGE